MRLRLRDGITPGQVLAVLPPLIVEAGNILSVSSTPGGVPALRDAYLDWADRVERQLVSFTHDRDVPALLHTPRYWHIRQIQGRTDARPVPLVQAEIASQCALLEELVADLRARVNRLSRAGGTIAIVDTNILLQYEEPWKVPWRKILNKPSVRLIVPLRVIEELDAKKYSESRRLAPRARALLPELAARIGPDGTPGILTDDVTIEVPVEPGARWRPLDADEEILDFCAEVPRLIGAQATLVTADTAMRLRAGAQGTPVVTMPDGYLRGGPPPPA